MSSVMQMAGAIASGIQNVYAYRRQQEMYSTQATQAMREAQANVASTMVRGRRLEASAIARAGASGVSEGQSALDVMVNNALAIGHEISTQLYTGEIQQWGLTEGAKAAGWAKHMTALTGFGEAAGHAASAWEKYGGKIGAVNGYKETEWNSLPDATKEAWFSNATSADWGGGGGEGFGGGGTAYGGQYAESGIV